MRYLNKVKEFSLLGGYRIRVAFRDGYTGEVDLWALFEKPKGPLTEPFRDPSFFQKAFLDEGTLSWPNSYDICSDVLRYYCEIGRVCADHELNAALDPGTNAPTSSALTLNDKPSSS
ncbi:MAG: DUF2442 domain-containing protein [Verrucomicrobia bacterium]|nr:DUF2442 domain-containing protein [Verrucomicrobiota bacterium]